MNRQETLDLIGVIIDTVMELSESDPMIDPYKLAGKLFRNDNINKDIILADLYLVVCDSLGSSNQLSKQLML
jgi:hypothetical protein